MKQYMHMITCRGVLMVGTILVMMPMVGCLAPGAVRLLNKPSIERPVPHNNVKIALIIRDDRPQAIQKINMCGVNYQTAFHIPVAPMILVHTEHLDSIVAHHVVQKLQNAGYTVVSTLPITPKALSETKVKPKDFAKEDRDAAWGLRKSQDLTAEERKLAKAKKSEVTCEVGDVQSLNPWGTELDVSQADYVLEVKIRKFWTDYSYYGSVSWVSINMALCKAHDDYRSVVFGTKMYGCGYMFSFFTPLTPSSDATVSANTAYWVVLNQIENQLRSGEIQQLTSREKADAINTSETEQPSPISVTPTSEKTRIATPLQSESEAEAKLKELKSLLDQGLIQQDEYEKKRNQIIDKI